MLTRSQRDVTDSTARVTVVTAGPGSGKTRVFVSMLREQLATWRGARSGVAALSFTNVAQDLVAHRLGGRPMAPHFVGTLDAFVWRFIVRPFGHLAGVRRGGASLLPGPLQDALRAERDLVQVGASRRDRENLFRVALWGGTEDRPQLAYKRQTDDAATVLPAHLGAAVMARKRQEWARTGRVTHSDCQFIAATILRGPHGLAVSDLLASRFPVVLVDEAQDTGWFLARMLHALFRNPRVRGVVTGDPDQGIYGFSGAKPVLFADLAALPGARSFSLHESHRCAPRIAAVASALTRSRAHIVPLVAHPGVAVLLIHRDPQPTLAPFVGATVKRIAEDERCSSVAVLARKTSVVRALAGGQVERDPPVTSRAAKVFARAAGRLRGGDPSAAARIAGAALGTLLLDDEHVTEALLAYRGIAPRSWRTAVGAVLLASASVQASDTWQAWLSRVRSCVEEQAVILLGAVPGDLGARMKCGSGGAEPRGEPVRSGDDRGWNYFTVHRAKGLEFDLVTYYSPKPSRYNPCPSKEWWSNTPGTEEREVAFVAASRASKALIVCIHADTAEELEQTHPDFTALFQIVRVPEEPKTSSPASLGVAPLDAESGLRRVRVS